MQKLCCVRTRQHPLPVWSHNLSLHHQLISQPILVHFWWELYQRTLYGVRNAAKAFWLVLLTLLGTFNILRSKADPCLYYKWMSAFGLIVVLSWIDDIMICGNKEGVLHYKKLLTEKIDCDDVGPLTNYIGNKIDIDRKNCAMRITQPVLLRSFKDEFNV